MIKYLLTILILILFGTVFITEQDIPNGLIESKSYGFVFVSICLGLVFLLILTFTKTFKLQISITDVTLFFFLLWIVFNSFIIKRLPSSITLEVFICSIVFSLILKQFILTDSRYKLYFTIACLVVGGGQTISGLLQLYGYQESLHAEFKMTGSFHNPGPFGIYVAAFFVFALGNYLFSKNPILKNISAIVCLMGILVLPSTQSRSAWIGAFGGIVYLLFIKYGLDPLKEYLSNKYTILGLITLSSVVGITLWNFKANSALGRTLTWRVSSEMVSENPLTGIGLGEFPNQFGFFQANFFKENPSYEQLIALADRNNYAFNDFIQIIVENGLIGFILFAILIFLAFSSQTIPLSNYISASRAGLITILLASCFSYPLELIPIWWLVLFFICLVSMDSSKKKSITPSIYTKIFVSLVFTLISIYILHYEVYVYQAKIIWFDGNLAVQQQNFKDAEKRYQEVINKLPYERLVLLDYGKILYMNGKIKQSVDILEKVSQTIADPFLLTNLGDSYQTLKKYELAEKAYTDASNMIPNRMYPKYLLAKMYLKKNDTLMAKKTAKKIVLMPVKVASHATTQMRNEMNLLLE